jgi:hypothetical protein
MQFFTALLSVLAIAVSTTAAPVHVAERSELIVVAPHITQPQGNDQTYYIGSTQTCCWETDGIPSSAIVGQTGTLVLGHYDPGSTSENLDLGELFRVTLVPVAFESTELTLVLEHPLSSGFLLTAGCVNYVVPNVPAGDSYFLVRKSQSGHVVFTPTLKLTGEEQ